MFEIFDGFKPIVDNKSTEWFAATAMTKKLGFKDITKAIKILDKKDVKTYNQLKQFIHNSPVAPDIDDYYISEPGVYALMFESKTPQALAFQDKITSSIIPSIIRKGEYNMEDDKQEQLKNVELKINKCKKILKELKEQQREILKGKQTGSSGTNYYQKYIKYKLKYYRSFNKLNYQ